MTIIRISGSNISNNVVGIQMEGTHDLTIDNSNLNENQIAIMSREIAQIRDAIDAIADPRTKSIMWGKFTELLKDGRGAVVAEGVHKIGAMLGLWP